MKKKCNVEEEIYTHEYLWRSSSALLKQGEKDESYHQLLPALLLSYMAFEAFVNFLGYILLPELWKNEKDSFLGKGVEGKLEKIISELPNFIWEKGKLPYQQIKKLDLFRNMVAHGKVLNSTYIADQTNDGMHFQFKHTWDEFLTFNSINSFRNEIKLFSQSLLIEARKESDHLQLIFDAYEGSLSRGQSESIPS